MVAVMMMPPLAGVAVLLRVFLVLGLVVAAAGRGELGQGALDLVARTALLAGGDGREFGRLGHSPGVLREGLFGGEGLLSLLISFTVVGYATVRGRV